MAETYPAEWHEEHAKDWRVRIADRVGAWLWKSGPHWCRRFLLRKEMAVGWRMAREERLRWAHVAEMRARSAAARGDDAAAEEMRRFAEMIRRVDGLLG